MAGTLTDPADASESMHVDDPPSARGARADLSRGIKGAAPPNRRVAERRQQSPPGGPTADRHGSAGDQQQQEAPPGQPQAPQQVQQGPLVSDVNTALTTLSKQADDAWQKDPHAVWSWANRFSTDISNLVRSGAAIGSRSPVQPDVTMGLGHQVQTLQAASQAWAHALDVTTAGVHHAVGDRWDTMSTDERSKWTDLLMIPTPGGNPLYSMTPEQRDHVAKMAFQQGIPSIPRLAQWFIPGVGQVAGIGDIVGQAGGDPLKAAQEQFATKEIAGDVAHPQPLDPGWDVTAGSHGLQAALTTAWLFASTKAPFLRAAAEAVGGGHGGVEQMMNDLGEAQKMHLQTGQTAEQLAALQHKAGGDLLDVAAASFTGVPRVELQPGRLKTEALAAEKAAGQEPPAQSAPPKPRLSDDPKFPYRPPPSLQKALDSGDPQAVQNWQVQMAAHDAADKAWFEDFVKRHTGPDAAVVAPKTPPKPSNQMSEAQRRQARDMQRHYQALGGVGRVASAEDLAAHVEDNLQNFSQKQRQMIQNGRFWNTYMDGPLYSAAAGDPAPLNPRHLIPDLPAAMQSTAHEQAAATSMAIREMMQGLEGSTNNPIRAFAQAAINQSRSGQMTSEHLTASMVATLHRAGLLKDKAQEQMIRALTGLVSDESVLNPAETFQVNSWRNLNNVLMRREIEAGVRPGDQVRPFYLPAAPADPVKMSLDAKLKWERDLANDQTFQTFRGGIRHGGTGVLGSAQGSTRERVKDIGFGSDWEHAVRDRWPDPYSRNEEMKRQQGAVQDWLHWNRPQWSPQTRQHIASSLAPLYETNLVKIVQKSLGPRIARLQAQEAVNKMLETTIGDDGLALAWRAPGPEVEMPGTPSRIREAASKPPGGYQSLAGGAFPGTFFHPEWAKLMNHALSLRGGDRAAVTKGLLGLERFAVQNIMYSPMIHGQNVLGRAGWLTFAKPIDTLRTIHKIMGKGFTEADWHNLQFEQMRHGGIPHVGGQELIGEMGRVLGEHTGDTRYPNALAGQDIGGLTPGLHPLATAAGAGKAVWHGYRDLYNYAWGKFHDFGTVAYAIEKLKAERHLGEGSQAAKLYAADRGNAWMGAVRPERWPSSGVHDLARIGMFAPNWWISAVDLLRGYADSATLGSTPGLRSLRAQNEVRTLIAMQAFQKFSGNALNMIGSGHPQTPIPGLGNQANQPGQRDRVDLSGLVQNWVNPAGRALAGTHLAVASDIGKALAGLQGIDPATGAHMVGENPLARPTYDTELAAGMTAPREGGPGYGDVAKGATQFAVNRASPLLNMAALAGMNLDIHRTILNNGEYAHVDPTMPSFAPSPAGALVALLEATPFGGPLTYEMEKQARAGNAPGKQGDPLAAVGRIPKMALDSMGGAIPSALMSALTGLAGVLPPHLAAQKTEGTYPSDKQFQDLQNYTKARDDIVNGSWRNVLLGLLPWSTAIKDYHAAQAQYRTRADTLFHGAPQWVNGTKGLLAQYEQIGRDDNGGTAKAFTDPETGMPDAGKIKAAQQQFQAQHAEDWPAVQAELTKNSQKNPLLKIYYDVVDNYAAWQDKTAQADLHVQPAQLRAHLTEYYNAYNDKQARALVESKHPDIRQYYALRKQWLTSTWGGLMWGMMYDNATVNNFLSGRPEGRAAAEQEVTQHVAQVEGVKP